MGANGKLNGWRVLVVEDEAMIATLLESILADAGCSVVGPIGTVGRALETLECDKVDVALLDVSVNGRDAYPIADKLKERNIPMVFVSGFSQQNMPSRYRRYAYLAKPFEPEAILAMLESVLDRRKRVARAR